MRQLLFAVFAIGVAAVAAMTATTAMLNAPRRSVPAAITAATPEPEAATGSTAQLAADTKPAAADDDEPPAKPASGSAAGKPEAGKTEAGEDEADKDPYEGIAPEELPPDMQYSADSSVSFPTNI